MRTCRYQTKDCQGAVKPRPVLSYNGRLLPDKEPMCDHHFAHGLRTIIKRGNAAARLLAAAPKSQPRRTRADDELYLAELAASRR